MVFNKTHWVKLVLAIGFAILQLLQPFIHAHVGTEYPVQHTGFHIADEHEEVFNMPHSENPVISHVVHAAHTILVAPGIKQDTDAALFADITFAVVLIFVLILALHPAQRFSPVSQLIFVAPLKRRLPAPRAPPKF